jgi:hypothetical protein
MLGSFRKAALPYKHRDAIIIGAVFGVVLRTTRCPWRILEWDPFNFAFRWNGPTAGQVTTLIRTMGAVHVYIYIYIHSATTPVDKELRPPVPGATLPRHDVKRINKKIWHV